MTLTLLEASQISVANHMVLKVPIRQQWYQVNAVCIYIDNRGKAGLIPMGSERAGEISCSIVLNSQLLSANCGCWPTNA